MRAFEARSQLQALPTVQAKCLVKSKSATSDHCLALLFQASVLHAVGKAGATDTIADLDQWLEAGA